MIEIAGVKAHLDYLLAADINNVAIISYYERSLSTLKSIGGALNFSERLTIYDNSMHSIKRLQTVGSGFNTYIQPVIVGKEKFFHAISISNDVNKGILILNKEDEANDYYNYLMKEFNLPLLREWGSHLLEHSKKQRYLHKDVGASLIKGQNSITDTMYLNNKAVAIKSVNAYTVSLNEELLSEQVSYLLKNKYLHITKGNVNKLDFSDMDSYFKKYGPTLVENLKSTIVPLTQLNGEVDTFTLHNKRLYPQQIAQLNGMLELLKTSSYGILNYGMGTGKTIIGAALAEAYFVKKWLRVNKDKTLKDAYMNEEAIRYRNIILCPGHLVSKWKSEIEEELPLTKVEIISEFKQLVEIRKKGMSRNGREFYIMSKDFGKLSYQSRPTVKKRISGTIMKKICSDCGDEYFKAGHTCPECSSRNYKLEKSSLRYEGMQCPHCKQLLLPYKTAKLTDGLDDEGTKPLDFYDFVHQNESNSRCYYCENELWEPHVANLGDSRKKTLWNRATHYSNKAHKGTKTVWIHKDYTEAYFEMIGEEPLNYIDSEDRRGSRKYSPARFIQKYMKGFWDIAIFDELQAYKGGTTGQGNCMASLVSSSKKQLGLTGTIAGGKADDLFYLLYRFDSKRMVENGYKFTDVMKFSEKYGRIETAYDYTDSENEAYNACCRGRQKGSPKVKPGISPLIFMDFLLDKCTFLDISDMSKHLPKLLEKVELVDCESDYPNDEGTQTEIEMLSHYNSILSSLKLAAREPDVGSGILSTMLQFSLSYLDKPYKVKPILSPKTGATIARINSYDMFLDYTNYKNLLSKEKRLIEIVSKEISEDRNCFIYAEFTGSAETCVTGRLEALLEYYIPTLKGKISILESSSPQASKREAWIHKKAKEGIKVFITNAKCVETGLDFRFKVDGKIYNYPTIIFYQMGYSMFTVAQAARRHYRLNQIEECRTYYLAVKGTVQQAVIQIIAEKTSATAAISGHFTTEGLSAMANGVDTKVKLAQAMANLDNVSGNELQNMFDVINQGAKDDSEYNIYKPMLLYSELIGAINKRIDKAVGDLNESEFNSMFNFFDFLETFNNPIDDSYNIEKDKKLLTSGESLLDESNIFFSMDKGDSRIDITEVPKKKKKKEAEGQIDIFAFCQY